MKKYKIAVAGTGYVGLSIATLLSQHHHVTAVDIVPEKVEMINNRKSPIQDDYIEKYLAEKDLDLTATLDAKDAYSDNVGLIGKYDHDYSKVGVSIKDAPWIGDDSYDFKGKDQKIIIEDDVWIGFGAIVLHLSFWCKEEKLTGVKKSPVKKHHIL